MQKEYLFLVDEYPACPENWMRSEGRLKSYFVPVEEDKGMWLDFNECSNHTHHVGIVISIQGINPITGLPCNDPQMEQYIDECPKHKTKFGPDRYCEKCGYRWPKQNYISTTGTPDGHFWIDGFKAVDGVVRQYILTAEKMRGVASNVIGKDRVYAIGLSFFLSKDKKPEQPKTTEYRGALKWHGNNIGSGLGNTYAFYSTCDNFYNEDNDTLDIGDVSDFTVECSSSNSSKGVMLDSLSLDSDVKASNLSKNTTKGVVKCGGKKRSKNSSKDVVKGITASSCLRSVKEVKTKKLEVGAGAKINQSIYDDPENLDFWHDTPESIICINYCTEKEATEIIEQGTVDIKGSEEGFLKDIPVGN